MAQKDISEIEELAKQVENVKKCPSIVQFLSKIDEGNKITFGYVKNNDAKLKVFDVYPEVSDDMLIACKLITGQEEHAKLRVRVRDYKHEVRIEYEKGHFVNLMNYANTIASRLKKIAKEYMSIRAYLVLTLETIQNKECLLLEQTEKEYPHLVRISEYFVGPNGRGLIKMTDLKNLPDKTRDEWIELKDDEETFTNAINENTAIICKISQTLTELEVIVRRIELAAGVIEDRYILEYISPSRVSYMHDKIKKVCYERFEDEGASQKMRNVEDRLARIKIHPGAVDWIKQIERDPVIQSIMRGY